MTKYDHDFCKPDENMRPLYCPLPLAVVIHHHDEGDDPETGEHWESDWDERRTEVFPSAEDKAAMDYLPLSSAAPVDPPEGKHYERTDKIEPNGDGGYRWKYTLVDDPPAPPRRWTRLDILTALGESDMFDAAVAYLNSIEVKPHITAWLGLNTANYIEEGYPEAERWNALLNGAANALGKTREEIDAFLDAIPREG